jgi:hypothetical protein
MSAATRQVLPVRAMAAISAEIGSVPGCRVEKDHRWRGTTTRTGAQNFTVTVQGRSPSLHLVTMLWDVEVDTSADDATIATEAVERISKQVAIQRERAEAGILLGDAFPLPMNPGYAAMGEIPVDHVSMDASALALRLSGLPSAAGRHEVRNSLSAPFRTIHVNGPHGNGGRSIRHDGTTVSDVGGRRRIDLTTSIPAGDGTTDAIGFLVGRRLHIDDVSLPDTALAAMGGRRLRDLAMMHPLLDDRLVETAANTRTKAGQHRIAVTLAPLLVPIGDVTGLARRNVTPREIVEHLKACISTHGGIK